MNTMLILDDNVLQAMPCSVKDNPLMKLNMPQNYPESLESVLREHAALFRCQLGRSHITKHVIDTFEATLVKLSPTLWTATANSSEQKPVESYQELVIGLGQLVKNWLKDCMCSLCGDIHMCPAPCFGIHHAH